MADKRLRLFALATFGDDVMIVKDGVKHVTLKYIPLDRWKDREMETWLSRTKRLIERRNDDK